MKKAFILTVHKEADQVNLFIKQLLADSEAYIYVHVNKLKEEMKDKIIKDERVFIANNNIEVAWGMDSILRAQLLMLKEAVSHKEYEYILFQTGQDLLIKPGLDDYLTKNKDRVFIDCFPEDRRRRTFLLRKWPPYMCRLMDKKYHPIRLARRLRMEMSNRGLPIAKKKIDFDVKALKFYKNYMWFGMPLEVARYILGYLDENPGYWTIYKDALIPEEAFWATTIMNSPFASRINYKDGQGKSLVYIRGIVNNHPPTFTMKDIEELEASGAFFARKFDINLDRDVVDYFCRQVWQYLGGAK